MSFIPASFRESSRACSLHSCVSQFGYIFWNSICCGQVTDMIQTTHIVLRAALRRPQPCIRSSSHLQTLFLSKPSAVRPQQSLRTIHTTRPLHAPDRPTSLTNMLASDVPPPVQVSSVGPAGITLADGLVLTGPVVFLEGKVLLWDVPSLGQGPRAWDAWTRAHWEVFDVVVPKPGRSFCCFPDPLVCLTMKPQRF